MNVVFITYDFPFPTTSGGKMRSYHLLKEASKHHNIHLVSFIRQEIKEEQKKALIDLGIKSITLVPRKNKKSVDTLFSVFSMQHSVFHTLYYNKETAQVIEELIESRHIDLVHFESYYTAFYIPLVKKKNIPTVFGTQNIEYLLYEDYAKYKSSRIIRPVIEWESKKIKKEEEKLLSLSDTVLAVTQKEGKTIENISQKSPHIVKNGVDLEYFSYKPKRKVQEKIILFIGDFSYFPNVDAISFFSQSVLPQITDKNIKTRIIGKHVDRLAIIDPRVEVDTYVPDIREEYYRADVFISPIRIGGGTNFKVLEAMSCGVPVVAFPKRVNPMGAQQDIHYLAAENAKTFYQAIMKVLLDENGQVTKMQKNARKFIEENFAWETIGQELLKAWEETKK